MVARISAILVLNISCLASAAELKHPDWHPGGEILAAEGSCSGNTDLYLIDIGGNNVSRLLGDHRTEGYPRWFADGQRIAFHRIDEQRNAVIVVADLDPELQVSNVSQLTSGPFDIEPAPSPGGDQLVFSTSGDDSLDVAILDLQSGQIIAAWRTPEAENFPSWHPDGQSILFHTRSGDDADIWRRDVSSGEVTAIPLAPGPNLMGSYDARGQRIAFNSERDGDREVYIWNPLDGSERRLTDRSGRDGYPKFSPDGRKVAYHAVLTDGDTVIQIHELATGELQTFSCDQVA